MNRNTNAPGPGAQQKGKQGRDFAEAPVGALFYLCHGNSPQLIGQFTSKAVPCAKGDGWLQRSYRVLKPAQRTDRYTASSKGWSPQGNSTFWQVGAHDLPEFESTLLKPYFGTDLGELAALAGEPIEVSNLGSGDVPPPAPTAATPPAVSPSTPAAGCINRIYYGPPGTGKTYELSKLLKREYEQAMTSVSNEEWRNQFIAEKIAPSKWWEGAVLALYDLGEKATVSQLLEHPFIDAIAEAKGRKDNLRQTVWTTLQERTIDESATVKQKLRFSPQVFDKNEESVWRLAGEWREDCGGLVALVNEYRAGAPSSEVLRRYSFVTFHQSYGYEEFVEGLRPVLNGNAEDGEIRYEIRSGVFKDLCRRARSAPDQRFAMVIDEINRGNISKIFGELITLIEPDKREGADAVPVTLPYSGESFSVPANVDIIGTMNTADRSLALLDTALRRRFDFVPLMPDARDETGAPLSRLRVTVGEHVIDIPRLLSAINQRVEALYDRDHCIGHAYFTPLIKLVRNGDDPFGALAQLFRNRIVPLLEEYFFEDWQKIRLVLADNQKPVPAQFVTEGEEQQDDLTRLFGNDHGLDTYATKRRYAVQDAAFLNPDAYIGVYETLAP